MNYFDPARGEPPRLLWDGQFIPGVVPSLNVTPKDPLYNRIIVEVCIIIAPNTARWLSMECEAEEFSQLLSKFRLNPEKFLQTHFSWHYTPTASKSSLSAKKETVTLADLGL